MKKLFIAKQSPTPLGGNLTIFPWLPMRHQMYYEWRNLEQFKAVSGTL